MPLKSIFTFFRAFFRFFSFTRTTYNSDFRFLYGWRVRQFMTLDLAFYAEKHVEHFSMADNSYICFFGALKAHRQAFIFSKRREDLCYVTKQYAFKWIPDDILVLQNVKSHWTYFIPKAMSNLKKKSPGFLPPR